MSEYFVRFAVNDRRVRKDGAISVIGQIAARIDAELTDWEIGEVARDVRFIGWRGFAVGQKR